MKFLSLKRMLIAVTALSAAFAICKTQTADVSVSAEQSYVYTIADYIRLRQYFMGDLIIKPEEYDKYDFSRDGVINTRDLTAAWMLLKREVTLPDVTLPEQTTVFYQAPAIETPFATVIVEEKPVTTVQSVTTAVTTTTTEATTTTTAATTTTVTTTTEPPVTTTVTTTTEPPVTTEAPKKSEGEELIVDSVKVDVDSILQMPELPKGSEVTALSMILNHYGFDASKELLADLMPKFNFYIIDDILYGADYINTYPGNPHSAVSGYGCYAPCMVTTADKYFKQTGKENYRLDDLTGSDFDTLLSYIDAGRPVMVWATTDMVEPEENKEWMTPDGRTVKWKDNEHCFVLTGYNRGVNTVYVNDPLKGPSTYSMSVFRFRYNQMGRYAAALSGSDIKEVTPAKPAPAPSSPSDCKYKVGDEVEYSGLVYYSANGGKSVEVNGTYEITEILDDDSKPYRIRLGTAGWVPIDFK